MTIHTTTTASSSFRRPSSKPPGRPREDRRGTPPAEVRTIGRTCPRPSPPRLPRRLANARVGTKRTNDERREGAFVHSLARRAFTDGRATAACVMCNSSCSKLHYLLPSTISSMTSHTRWLKRDVDEASQGRSVKTSISVRRPSPSRPSAGARLRKIFIRSIQRLLHSFPPQTHTPKPPLSRQVQVLREIVKVLAVLGVRL